MTLLSESKKNRIDYFLSPLDRQQVIELLQILWTTTFLDVGPDRIAIGQVAELE